MQCSIVEYYVMLMNHDWYFANSDDPRVYREGNENYVLIKNIAEIKGNDYERMFKQFKESMYSGDAWGTPKKEIPRLNEYI